jgi:hypothetical protein
VIQKKVKSDLDSKNNLTWSKFLCIKNMSVATEVTTGEFYD